MGGSIHLQSQFGAGTTVVVVIPLVLSTADDNSATEATVKPPMALR